MSEEKRFADLLEQILKLPIGHESTIKYINDDASFSHLTASLLKPLLAIRRTGLFRYGGPYPSTTTSSPS